MSHEARASKIAEGDPEPETESKLQFQPRYRGIGPLRRTDTR
jgi:hypothetical protein